MTFFVFPLLVWLLLAAAAYAAWMLRDAWKKGRSRPEWRQRPWLRRLFSNGEIASQVVAALGVCAVVGYALHSILRDDSFQDARDLTVSWVTSKDPDEPSDEESNRPIPAKLFLRDLSRPGGDIVYADIGTLPITDRDLQWMTQEYPHLERVVLSGTRITDDGLAAFSRLKNLHTLTLNRVSLTDAGLAHLAVLTNLRVLDLSGCRISDAGVAQLRSLGNLRELDLGGTQVTDAGLASLGSMTELEFLDLSRTAITGAGLRHLEKLPKLRNVWLYDTAVPLDVRAPFRNR